MELKQEIIKNNWEYYILNFIKIEGEKSKVQKSKAI